MAWMVFWNPGSHWSGLGSLLSVSNSSLMRLAALVLHALVEDLALELGRIEPEEAVTQSRQIEEDDEPAVDARGRLRALGGGGEHARRDLRLDPGADLRLRPGEAEEDMARFVAPVRLQRIALEIVEQRLVLGGADDHLLGRPGKVDSHDCSFLSMPVAAEMKRRRGPGTA